MSTINVKRTVSSQAASDPIRMDPNNKTFQVSLYMDTVIGTFVGVSDAQFTLDKPDPTLTPDNWANSIWHDYGLTDDILTGKTGPVEGIRLNVSAFTSGFVTLQVVQGKYSI